MNGGVTCNGFGGDGISKAGGLGSKSFCWAGSSWKDGMWLEDTAIVVLLGCFGTGSKFGRWGTVGNGGSSGSLGRGGRFTIGGGGL